jgi:predicted metal-dependent hydrolase
MKPFTMQHSSWFGPDEGALLSASRTRIHELPGRKQHVGQQQGSQERSIPKKEAQQHQSTISNPKQHQLQMWFRLELNITLSNNKANHHAKLTNPRIALQLLFQKNAIGRHKQESTLAHV